MCSPRVNWKKKLLYICENGRYFKYGSASMRFSGYIKFMPHLEHTNGPLTYTRIYAETGFVIPSWMTLHVIFSWSLVSYWSHSLFCQYIFFIYKGQHRTYYIYSSSYFSAHTAKNWICNHLGTGKIHGLDVICLWKLSKIKKKKIT